MNLKRICPYCNAEFMTEINSKKYCRKQCAVLAARRNRNALKTCMCLWCGQVFKAARERRFCDNPCRDGYKRQVGLYLKKETRVPVKISVNDVAKQCKIQGISYGKYVQMKKL